MVSAAEFDKNQKTYSDARQKLLEQGQAAAQAPTDPTGQSLVDTVGSGALLAAGGAALGGGAILGSSGSAATVGTAGRSAISNAARTAYQQAIANGASKSAAAGAARVAAAKASQNAAFMAGNYAKWFAEMIGKKAFGKVVGFGIGTGLSLGLFGVVRGILTDKEASVGTLTDWYVKGIMNKQEFETAVHDLDFGEQEKFYLEEAEMKKEEKAMQDMEKELGLAVVPPEFLSVEGESPEARQARFVQEQIRLNSIGNEQGMTVAQIENIQRDFIKGQRAGEIEKQKQESLQKEPPTVEELTQLPPGQMTPEEQEKVIKATTPNEPLPTTNGPPVSQAPNVTPAAPASLQFSTKQQFEQARGQSVTDAEWQRYLRTGRIR